VSITTMDQLASAIAASQDISFYKASMTSAAGFWSSLWAEAGFPAAGSLSIGNTANGLVPTDATAGAPVIDAFGGGASGYVGAWGCLSSATGAVVVYDRVFHAGSFVMSSLTTLSLTSQPSYAGRVPGSNWKECEIWIEVNTVFSASAVTLQVSYQDGDNAAQNTVVTGSLTGYPTKRMFPLSLANSTGVQRINSVTIGGATNTGTFNIVVLRRLVRSVVATANIGEPRLDFFRTGGQTIFADSCLALMWLGTGTSSGNVFADCQIING
jgi:hypothetical protein